MDTDPTALEARRARQRQVLRRGVYILPMSFSVGNLFCGFFSVILAMRGQFFPAATSIFVAMVLDGFDGRVARMTHTSSEFGKEYDSLADVVSFGVAPAFLVYMWTLHLFEKSGWPIAFIFLLCGSMRLARFNIQTKAGDKRYFVGLPIPMGAAMLAALVLASPNPAGDLGWGLFVIGVVLVTSYLMISTIRYRSFKDFDLKRALPPAVILLIAALIISIYLEPGIAVLTFVSAFVISGPIVKLWVWIFRRPHASDPAATPGDSSLV